MNCQLSHFSCIFFTYNAVQNWKSMTKNPKQGLLNSSSFWTLFGLEKFTQWLSTIKKNTNLFSEGQTSFVFRPGFWNLIQVERVWTKKAFSITSVKWNWQSNPWRQTVFTNFPYQSDNNMVKYLSWHWEAVFNWWSVWKHHVTRPVEGLLCNQVILDETGRYLSLEICVWSVMYSRPSAMISERVSDEREKEEAFSLFQRFSY